MPPQAQMSLEELLSIGMDPAKTVGFPTIQGAGVTGIQGDGAPSFAITVGFAGLVHMPNEGMLSSGILSIILAAGRPDIMILLRGSTLSGTGAAPNEHCRSAVETTACGMILVKDLIVND